MRRERGLGASEEAPGYRSVSLVGSYVRIATPSPTIFESTSRRGFLSFMLPEDALSTSEYDRKHHEPELVDEILFEQRVHELGAAVDDYVAVVLLASAS